MDVGIASLRNLSKIHGRRVVLWWLLALSSLPIHFLYNSAVFKTIEANNYLLAVVNEDFLKGEPFLDLLNITWTNSDGDIQSEAVSFEDIVGGDLLAFVQKNVSANAAYMNGSLYERLDNSKCMSAYGTSYVSGRVNVLAVTSASTDIANQTAFYVAEVFVPSDYYNVSNGPPFNWICEDDPTATLRNCDIAKQQRNAKNWNVNGYRIDYCLSELSSGPGQCRLQFSTTILAVVIVMNICKCLAMVLTLLQNREVALVTVGDALASFLEKPDHLTEGRCMLAKIDVEKTLLRSTMPPVSRLIIAALCAAVALLVSAFNWLKRSLDPNQSVFSLGFGTVDSRATIVDSLPKSNGAGLAAAVLVANLPQVICSLLYFAYNALLTSMLLSYEYSQYGVGGRRKALRVSSPKGQKRSKYFLHLPYTYSVPLIAISTLLHWLISQSLFVTEDTPNADALKFRPNHDILPDNFPSSFLEYLSPRSTLAPPHPSPLAAQLLNVDGVTSVFYGKDYITVTKDSSTPWAHVKPEVFSLISETVTSGQPIVNTVENKTGEDGQGSSSSEAEATYAPEDEEVVGMIQELLETRIRPAIQEDGGDIEFRGLHEGQVMLKLRGA
ncbi:hypothetical protein B0A55_10035 [Friedmanniomyces simplex]|uniref:Scaffold protein Nfu/NifU N-terminal domain-containing protein n=1 Tax=Friedmanniomyces simplex TaxID=329884 RepID=A0A4U0WZC1_9PEZI|nr:hypothetical protein B0A55_10035 [Friedmanniomyces simplex]